LRTDELIVIGLTNRPELASQQALVQAALVRIKQERVRPLLPEVLVQGGSNPASPGGYMMGGIFGSTFDTTNNPWALRDDIGIGVYWGLDNMGLGNHAQVRVRRSEEQQALIELSRLEDMVAADVVRAHASLKTALIRSDIAATGLQEAQETYTGAVEELGNITTAGDVKILKRRTFEVIDALRALLRAYDNYFISVNDYNRAQFRLYRALGYPADCLTGQQLGAEVPVDTSRPPCMSPVCPTSTCPLKR
jgi:outer membrane protein TolC